MSDEKPLWERIHLMSRVLLEQLHGTRADQRPLFVEHAGQLGGSGLDGALMISTALGHLRVLGYVDVMHSGSRLSISLTPAGRQAAIASAADIDEGLLDDDDFDRLLTLGGARSP